MHPSPLRGFRPIALLALILLVGTADPAKADDARLLATRKAKNLQPLVERLQAAARKAGFHETETAVDLFHSVVYGVESGRTNRVVNKVRWILQEDPAAAAPYVDYEFESGGYRSQRAESAYMWKLSRDGEMERFDGMKNAVDLGEDRKRIRLSVGSVQPGDVVGASFVWVDPQPMAAARREITEGYPVVLFQMDLEIETRSKYEVWAQNLDPSFYSLKVVEMRDMWPYHKRLTGRNVPPAALGAFQLPAYAAVPTVNIRLETREDDSGVRESFVHWNQEVMRRSWFWREAEPKDGAVEEMARTLVPGATTDRERADRIFRWLRDEVSVPEHGIRVVGSRTLKELLESREASQYEKSLLMVTMLEACGIDADVGLLRPKAMGSVGDNRPRLPEFPFDAVVCRIDGEPVVYQSEWPGQDPGEIGAELSGAIVWSLELVDSDELHQLQKDQRLDASVSGADRILRDRPWSEKLVLRPTTELEGNIVTELEWDAALLRAEFSLDATGPSDALDLLWRAQSEAALASNLGSVLALDGLAFEVESMQSSAGENADRTRLLQARVVRSEGTDASAAAHGSIAHLLGSSPVLRWQDSARASFYVRQPETFRATARVPIDDATAAAFEPMRRNVSNARFDWSVKAEVTRDPEQAWLVVSREVKTKPGQSFPTHLEGLRMDLATLREVESRILVGGV